MDEIGHFLSLAFSPGAPNKAALSERASGSSGLDWTPRRVTAALDGASSLNGTLSVKDGLHSFNVVAG
jgi:hypothetical protein